MDPAAAQPSRIAYSFPAGTFDLRRLSEKHCFEADDGQATVISLDGDWSRFFQRLPDVGLIMATAAKGPISMAAAWGCPRLQEFPGASEWICLETGTEIRPAAFGGAMAVVEEVGEQQMASIQFFDRQREGCLKLLMTNWSDLEAFEALTSRHASFRKTTSFGVAKSSTLPPVETVRPETATVRRLWNGLCRSLPDSNFPGLDGVRRQDALKAVGEDLAWRLPFWIVRQALQEMSLALAPLGGAVRNEAVFLPLGFHPKHWNRCGCGMTFFGETSQITLRRSTHEGQAWATRFTRGTHEVICIELYDDQGTFCGAIGLRPEATPAQYEQWNQLLRECSAKPQE